MLAHNPTMMKPTKRSYFDFESDADQSKNSPTLFPRYKRCNGSINEASQDTTEAISVEQCLKEIRKLQGLLVSKTNECQQKQETINTLKGELCKAQLKIKKQEIDARTVNTLSQLIEDRDKTITEIRKKNEYLQYENRNLVMQLSNINKVRDTNSTEFNYPGLF
ncbi:hypothetical protein WA158_005505 [Blastocystis sp. Blastoise]